MPGGQWATSNRRAELPPNWYSEIRPRILARDDYRCQWQVAIGWKCGAYANQVDHIHDRHDHSDGNLQSLCHGHHQRKSSGEGAAAQHAQRPKRQRPAEAHPGLTG